jgi:hypothetical protein
MNKCLKALIALLATITIISVLYISGSFYSTSFNPAKWSEGTRAAIAMFGCLTAIAGIIITCGLTGVAESE